MSKPKTPNRVRSSKLVRRMNETDKNKSDKKLSSQGLCEEIGDDEYGCGRIAKWVRADGKFVCGLHKSNAAQQRPGSPARN